MRTRTHPAILVGRRMREVDCSDPNACHLWPGVKARGGYGLVSPRVAGVPMERVSRVVLEEKLGRPLRPGYYACHHCDNPPCCNSAHLYEGTQKQNLDDARKKGRWTIDGEGNPAAKLTDLQVRNIKADPRSNAEIAAEVGQPEQIRRIKKGERWSHL